MSKGMIKYFQASSLNYIKVVLYKRNMIYIDVSKPNMEVIIKFDIDNCA